MNREQFAYMKIYNQIRDEIIGACYPPGGRLPSKRMLADRFSASLITVQHALDLLEDEGYTQSVERKGNFVVYRSEDAFPNRERRVTVEAHGNSGLDFPFSAYAKRIRWVLSEYGEDILRRSSHEGCGELRKAIADYLLRSRGLIVNERQIIIGSGSEYLYGLVLQMMGQDTVYAIEIPSYEQIERVYQAHHVKLRRLPLEKDGIKKEALQSTDASVLHITPYRSFPSGFSADAGKKREYLEWMLRGERYIIEDDFSSEFNPSSKPAETVYSLDRSGHVIYMNSFSLTVAPGVRTAYMVLPLSLLPSFEETVGFYSCTVPTFEQLILASFLNSGEFERHLNRERRKRRKNENERRKP